MTTYKCRYCDAISHDDNISRADGVCLQHPAGAGNHTFRSIIATPETIRNNRLISFINDVRILEKRWRTLGPDQKRAVLAAIAEDSNADDVLAAIKKIKKAA